MNCEDVIWDTARGLWTCADRPHLWFYYAVVVALTVVIVILFIYLVSPQNKKLSLCTGDRMSHDREELEILRRIEGILEKIFGFLKPRLSSIKISFGGSVMAQGPVTLTVGQKTKATVVGFDQFGAVFTGTIPPVTYAIDNPTLDSSTPDGSNGDDIVSLAAGVANLTATLTTVEGKQLSDTETITNVAIAQILSSIKLDFSPPA